MAGSVIIGIHGLANKPPHEQEEGWWRSAILEGLQRNRARAKTVLDADFDFVYWADLRYSSPINSSQNLEPYYKDEDDGPFPDYSYNAWVKLLDEISGAIGTVGHFLNHNIKFLQWLDNCVLEKELDDLHAYYSNTKFRNDARQRLMETLQKHDGKRIMLIAHSMGSIIAYDVLRLIGRKSFAPRVDHFVTIGSPLGLPIVRTTIAQENDLVRTPSNVGSWSNFADRRDIVAVDSKLADDFEANDQGVKVKDIYVINAYRSPPDRNPSNHPNFHKSYGYLRTPEFSRLLQYFF